MTMSGGECPMIPEIQVVFLSMPVCVDATDCLKEVGKE
jgi:hypothetical protein